MNLYFTLYFNCNILLFIIYLIIFFSVFSDISKILYSFSMIYNPPNISFPMLARTLFLYVDFNFPRFLLLGSIQLINYLCKVVSYLLMIGPNQRSSIFSISGITSISFNSIWNLVLHMFGNDIL